MAVFFPASIQSRVYNTTASGAILAPTSSAITLMSSWWLDPESTQQGRIFSLGLDGSAETVLLYHTTPLNRTVSPYFRRDTTDGKGAWNGYGTHSAIPLGEWVTVAVVSSSDPLTLPTFYTNIDTNGKPSSQMFALSGAGLLFGAPTGGYLAQSSPGWRAGHLGYSPEQCGLAHVQMWNRALSADELTTALRRPGGVREGQTLWIPFEGTGIERINGWHGNARGGVRRVIYKGLP